VVRGNSRTEHFETPQFEEAAGAGSQVGCRFVRLNMALIKESRVQLFQPRPFEAVRAGNRAEVRRPTLSADSLRIPKWVVNAKPDDLGANDIEVEVQVVCNNAPRLPYGSDEIIENLPKLSSLRAGKGGRDSVKPRCIGWNNESIGSNYWSMKFELDTL
jgi:hypothetical protein